ncbi:MAG: IclR family transcriptional regulator [Thermoanaerobaculia bacterium]
MVRAVAVLKAFDETRREWGVTELAQRLGLAKATVYRLLAALVDTGMVAQDPESERYRLGPEAIALGARALQASDLRTACRPVLEELARVSGETATLDVLVEDEVLILDEVAGRHLIGVAAEVGTRWPAHAASTGKLLLAHRERTAVSAGAGYELAVYTPYTITNRDALEREFARILRQGYASAIEELQPDFVAVAAPVRDHRGRVVAGISLGGPAARLDRRRIAELAALLRRAADRASIELGWTGSATDSAADAALATLP